MLDNYIFELFPDISQVPLVVPFCYFLYCFPTVVNVEPMTGYHLLEIYATLLDECKEALGMLKEAKPCLHNFVLVQKWMMLIQRRRSDVDGGSANAAGIKGMVWVVCDEKVEKW
jgi:ATP adenylyltransferase/5',5'''-P-1,P-4-tetraphosphate phosphorylase II